MISVRMKPTRLGLALLGASSVLAASPAAAQVQQQGAYREDSGTALTRHLRTLSEQPRSLHALTGAGKAALELGDPQAALTFFARAEEVAPRDGRVKAGMGSAFLAMEQPMTAMRLFGEAASLGVPEAEFAGDRGLVHDLNGDPRRAQADYALSLSRTENDEVRRRLALSLAITGDRDRALSTIDAQLRRQDRAAWRTRAFILALSGDAPGATRTAESMMPAQAAQLQPFFARLPSLSAAQRAMAVHFGHFPGDGQTLQTAGTQYASAAPIVTPRAQADQAVGSRRRPAQPVAEQPRARQSASESSRAEQQQKEAPAKPRREAAEERERFNPWDRSGGRRARTATVNPKPATPPPAAQQRIETAVVAPPPVAQQRAETVPVTPQPTPSPPPAAIANLGSLVESLPADAPAAGAAQNVPADTPPAEPGPAQQAPAETASIQPTSLPPSTVSTPEPARQEPSDAPARTTAFTLADIAAAIASLPEEKPATPAASPPQRIQLAEGKTAPPAPARATESKPKPAETAKPAVVKSDTASQKQAADKAASDKAATAKKDAAAKKEAAPKKEPAAKKEAPPKEPSRHWVQIAGGANEAAMTTEFKRLKGKAPKLLGARTAWTTPLRATNRLLVGPFKTPAEAQEFVNEMAKLDLPAFSWTSPAGQEIVKLSAK